MAVTAVLATRCRARARSRKHASAPQRFCTRPRPVPASQDLSLTLGQQHVVTDGHIGRSRFLTRDPLTAITNAPYAYANDDPVNEADPLGLWGWNPISDVSQGWSDTGGKAVHFVDKHKAAIGEIAVGVVVVAGITVATVATGGLADAVAIGAAGAAEEVASAAAGESLVGLFGLTFPLDATFALAPVAFVGLGGLALTGYGAYELYSQLSGGSATPKCGQQ